MLCYHDDVIKWKYFPRYWPFARGIHRSTVNSLHKGQWRGALIFSLICVWINDWVNNGEAGDLRRHRAHYDVTVMHQRALCWLCHYSDVIFDAMASQITGVSIAKSTVCLGADQRKHQSSVSLAFVMGIHRWLVNSPHKGPVTRKMFPFDDVIIQFGFPWFLWPQVTWRFSHFLLTLLKVMACRVLRPKPL